MLKLANISDAKVALLDLSGISDQTIVTFSWIVFGALCLGIVAFGIVTNIVNTVCFFKQSFQDSVNISLFGMYGESDLKYLIAHIFSLCVHD